MPPKGLIPLNLSQIIPWTCPILCWRNGFSYANIVPARIDLTERDAAVTTQMPTVAPQRGAEFQWEYYSQGI